MPAAQIRISESQSSFTNPLPQLLHTPNGLAVLELQGTLHIPPSTSPVDVGRLEFPLYNSETPSEDLGWTKKVYLYVGKNQRMTGSVKKLEKPLAILKSAEGVEGSQDADVKVMGIVKWKVVFSARPEPVGED